MRKVCVVLRWILACAATWNRQQLRSTLSTPRTRHSYRMHRTAFSPLLLLPAGACGPPPSQREPHTSSPPLPDASSPSVPPAVLSAWLIRPTAFFRTPRAQREQSQLEQRVPRPLNAQTCQEKRQRGEQVQRVQVQGVLEIRTVPQATTVSRPLKSFTECCLQLITRTISPVCTMSGGGEESSAPASSRLGAHSLAIAHVHPFTLFTAMQCAGRVLLRYSRPSNVANGPQHGARCG